MTDDTNDDRGSVSDEQFDRWLHASVREYNRPPAESVPLDLRRDMWREIERSLPVPATIAGSVPARRNRRFGAPWWQAAAAVLLLAAGIGIGRQWSTPAPEAPGLASAESPNDVGSRSSTSTDPSGSVAAAGSQVGEPLDASAPAFPVGSSTPDAARRAGANPGAAASPGSAAGNPSYDVAALTHLSRAEALLVSFRGARGTVSESVAESAPMNRWARDLLADTRLLLDSPAATDAQRRALLEDLELILAQIVQLPAESSGDRGVVQRSIERGAVLSRLRSSIPAGFSSGT